MMDIAYLEVTPHCADWNKDGWVEEDGVRYVPCLVNVEPRQ